ncbi:RHS repeat-associated core domain-containing protein [Micromonospora echinospora]
MTLAYHVNGYVRSISQSAGGSATYTVDVTGERLRTWSDNRSGAIVQSTHHYDGDGDNPSWTQETAARYTRPVAGVAGVAGDFDSGTGEIRWRISNLHDDVVASVQGNAEGLSEVSEFNEHGLAQEEGVTGVQRYGWLGAKQRAADTPTGLVLMGVRLYNPYTGRFLSQDPVQGGNANPYEYCFGDPVGCADLSGKGSSCRWPNCGRVINMHVWPLKIARDRCGSFRLCPGTRTKWLYLYQSSRRHFQDTDSYRFFGFWYPVQNKWTAVGHGTYHYRYPHAW